jgi:hypothetical protein
VLPRLEQSPRLTGLDESGDDGLPKAAQFLSSATLEHPESSIDVLEVLLFATEPVTN